MNEIVIIRRKKGKEDVYEKVVQKTEKGKVVEEVVTEHELINTVEQLSTMLNAYDVVVLPVSGKSIRVYRISSMHAQETEANEIAEPFPSDLGLPDVPPTDAQGRAVPGQLVPDYNNPIYRKKIEAIGLANSNRRMMLRRVAALRDLDIPGNTSEEKGRWLEEKFVYPDLRAIDKKILEKSVIGMVDIEHFLGD